MHYQVLSKKQGKLFVQFITRKHLKTKACWCRK